LYFGITISGQPGNRFKRRYRNPIKDIGSFENDPKVLKQYELGQGRNSQDRVILSVEQCLRLVKPEGLVAIIMIVD